MISDIRQKQVSKPVFKAKLHPVDLKYKQMLREGIQDTFQFSPKIEDLDSIAGPVELRQLLKSFSYKDYKLGDRKFNELSSPTEFKNVEYGFLRANLHVHTNKSDGKMSPQEFLEMSNKYANKVAKNHFVDDLPAYTSATTDHNNFEAAKEIIASIAEEPKKYKNFKFVSGSEFMLIDNNSPFQYKAFEGIGLGFNPFDKELASKTTKMNDISLIKDIKKDGAVVSYAHPIPQLQGNGAKPEFIQYLINNGVDAIESHYQFHNFKKTFELQKGVFEADSMAQVYGLMRTGGTDSHCNNIFGQRAGDKLNILL